MLRVRGARPCPDQDTESPLEDGDCLPSKTLCNAGAESGVALSSGMDIFFLQLVIIFIPGIIWERIDNRFGVNRPSNQFDIARRSFGFGVTSYLFEVLIYKILGNAHAAWKPYLRFEMAAFQKDKYYLDSDVVAQIFAASLMSLIFSIVWLYITNNKLPTRFMQMIGATRRFGDEDVWDYMLNSRGAEVEYIHVRDLENELNWAGWVELFSETGKTRELVLRDVEVTNIVGEVQYFTPRVYLARPADSITIEFPYRITTSGGASDGTEEIIAGEEANSDGRLPR